VEFTRAPGDARMLPLGEGSELIELAKTNLRELEVE
jgi:hypothetical protein